MRVYNSLKVLSRAFDIELLYIDTEKITIENERELLKYCKKVTPFVVSKFDFIIKTIWGLFTNKKPLQVNYYYFNKLQRYVDSVIDNHDAVFCNHIRTTEYAVKHNIPKFVDLVDSIAMNYTKAYPNAKGIWKFIYKIEKTRVQSYETFIVSNFTKSSVISEVDRSFIDYKNSYNIDVIGNFVRDFNYDSEIYPNESRICFLGKMDYEPNVTAALYFVKNIFPKLKCKNKDVEFVIIGSNPTREVLKLQSIEGVEVTGFVDNPYDIIQSCALFVAPMMSGAGVQNKILEAMSMGKCVITTKIGAEGLISLKGDEIIICNDINDMVENIHFYLSEKSLASSVGSNASVYIQNTYTEEIISKQILEFVSR